MTRWTIALFIAIGVLVALVLIVRDLGSGDEPEETGTLGAYASPTASAG